MGYDHTHMLKYIEFAQKNCTDPIRFEVLNMVMNIIGSIDDKGNSN